MRVLDSEKTVLTARLTKVTAQQPRPCQPPQPRSAITANGKARLHHHQPLRPRPQRSRARGQLKNAIPRRAQATLRVLSVRDTTTSAIMASPPGPKGPSLVSAVFLTWETRVS